MKKEETLDDFRGWEEGASQDFFGEKQLDPVTITITEPEPKPEGEDDDPNNPKPEPTEEKVEFFGKEEGDEDDPNPEPTPEVAKAGPKATLELLKEKGLINYELQEGEELTDELADEILEDNWDASIIEGVEAIIKDLPAPVKDLVKYATQGGDINVLLSKMIAHATSEVNKDTDMTSEENQVKAVATDLKAQGYDQEYIDTHIQFLKDSGKLETISTKAFDKITAKQETERSEEVARAEFNKADKKEKAKAYKAKVNEFVSSIEEVGGLTLNKEDKSGNLASYIADAKVTLKDGRVISQFQSDLFAVMADVGKTALLAKLIKSDFDFTPIKNATVTGFSKEAKQKLENAQKIELKQSKGSSQNRAPRTLADLLD